MPEHWRTFGQRSSPITARRDLRPIPPTRRSTTSTPCLRPRRVLPVWPAVSTPVWASFTPTRRAAIRWSRRHGGGTSASRRLPARPARGHAPLAAKDFIELRTGVCRVLAAADPHPCRDDDAWAKAIAPVVETVAVGCSVNRPTDRSPADAVHRSNRSDGRDGVRRTAKNAGRPSLRNPLRRARCGGPLQRATGTSATTACPTKTPSDREVLGAGRAALAKMRSEGRDPMDSPDARRKLGEANARRRREEPSGIGPTRGPTRRCSRARYCRCLGRDAAENECGDGAIGDDVREVRRGYVPHPRHWERLRNLDGHPAETQRQPVPTGQCAGKSRKPAEMPMDLAKTE